MNTQLVESLMQVILSLPAEEQTLLAERIADVQSTQLNPTQFAVVDIGSRVLQSLIATGRITPPPQHQDIPAIAEAELRELVNNLSIPGQPLSETIIEDRGEW
jgi:hypothetical protein